MAQRGANKKLTTDEFIERARKAHGDRYDYSQVTYDGMHIPVTIVCPDHGAFLQKPVDHLSGCGCPRCAQARRGRKRLTTEEFVERSRAVHGDRYDYSKAVYVDKRTKVEIVCPEHGSFWQLPTNHWKGQGCPVCAGRAREFTTESFVERARKVHGDAYDYSQVEYKTMRTPVTIVCPEHGAFQQMPLAHLKGRGCPQCGAIRAARSSANDPTRLARIAATCEREYGHACYLQSEEGKAKAVASSRKRFGADSFMASDERVRRESEMQEKREETLLEHFGVRHQMESPEIKRRSRATCRRRYSHDTYFGSELHRARMDEDAEKSKQTCLERYGVEFYSQSEEFRARVKEMHAKARRTMEANGTKPYFATEERLANFEAEFAKARRTCMERYGVEYYTQSDEWQARKDAIFAKRLKTMKAVEDYDPFHHSFCENALYELLVERFGADDVEREYDTDPRYPWRCDFYIKSRDLFIELNAAWTHGGHWFGDQEGDEARLSVWRELAEGSDYYRNAVHVWSEADVEKRERARAEGLNYLTFWSSDLADASVWFALECPDGHDWERIWSWMPERELVVPQPAYNATTDRFCSMAARWAQQDVFYGREKALWADDRRGLFWDGHKLVMPERMRLLANRVEHADAPLMGLSDAALLRGFGISGRVLAYTVFNTKLAREVLERYGATSVADPCAGWGERAMLCAQLGLPYEGVDVNEALADGYDRMLSAFGDGQQTFALDRGESHAFALADVMLTCPPYHDREIYSDAGAEHLDADAFAAWWRQVCENMAATASPRLMVVQTNQACRDVFLAGMEAAGYRLVEEPTFNVRASHRNRRVGGRTNKREFESVLVCERVGTVD